MIQELWFVCVCSLKMPVWLSIPPRERERERKRYAVEGGGGGRGEEESRLDRE